MVNSELYSQTNSLTKEAANQCLEEYAAKLKWKESGETIIDLGCGEGSVTCILKKYVPDKYETFVASDINEESIEYAKEHHADKNIVFRTIDIAGDMPDDLKGVFNHVFSFFLLHWVHDQEKAFKNIYELMRPGGECLMMIAGYNPVSCFFDELARDETFIKLEGFGKSVATQYIYMKNVETYLTNLMKNIGFININVQLKKRTFHFKNTEHLKEFVKAVEPYKFPENVFDMFFQKFMIMAEDKGIYFDKKTTDVKNLNKEVRFEYDTYVIHGCKPNK